MGLRHINTSRFSWHKWAAGMLAKVRRMYTAHRPPRLVIRWRATP